MTPFDARSVAQPRRQRQRESDGNGAWWRATFGRHYPALIKDDVGIRFNAVFAASRNVQPPRITFILNWINSS
jgi:hypothetical protein